MMTNNDEPTQPPRAEKIFTPAEIRGYPHRAGSISLVATVAALVVFLLAAGVTALNWDTIPDRFATHFRGSDFEPDSWADKSVGSVFFATFFGLVMTLGFALLSYGMLRSEIPARTNPAWRSKLRQHIILRTTAMWLAVLNLTMALLFAGIQLCTTIPAFMGWLPATILGGLVLVVGTSLGMVVALVMKQPTVEATVQSLAQSNPDRIPQEAPESTRDSKYYKWDMFYYNPDDPAIIVEKRYGVGVDFNYAHWQGKVFMVFVALVLAGSIALPFLL
ncbi:DUF5808 domain-containing protein [Corynebacterium auriscanis]|uniref:DUF5808 domain-containing protein n=1 Tax=Corynebacterium auriscanis TaxID=99807 RepID=UPI0022458D5A|nr:DUF5808 domain-containing protein [Corynebacterium auriscanis]MCX2163031.1 DUF1648 domain-containing protein [Corynebacterium auriscanis]